MGLAFHDPSTKRTEPLPAPGSGNLSVWDPCARWNWLLLALEKLFTEDRARQVMELVTASRG